MPRGCACPSPLSAVAPGAWDSDEESLAAYERSRDAARRRRRAPPADLRDPDAALDVSPRGGDAMTWTPGSLPADQDPSLAAAPRVVFPPLPAPAMSRDFPATVPPGHDAYGFPLPTDADALAARARCDASARKRSPRWDLFRNARGADAFKNLYPGCNAADDFGFVGATGVPSKRLFPFDHLFDALIPTPRSKVRRAWAMLKTLTRKGVPHDLRPHVWWHASGAFAARESWSPGFYASLRDAFDPSAGGRAPTEREKKTLEQIDLDVERTFPENPVFTDEKRGPRGTRRILTALAKLKPETGYCQGMNYIAGFAWLVHEGDEEKAFWTVFALLQNVVADRVHSHDIGGCVSEFRVLHRLIRRSLPRLHRHFEKTGTDLVMVAARWLLCFLVESFPPETTARAMDAIFSEGVKVWFRVVLATLKMNEREILSAKTLPEIMTTLRSAFRETHDRDALMRVAFAGIGRVSRKDIQRHRDTVRKEENAEKERKKKRE